MARKFQKRKFRKGRTKKRSKVSKGLAKSIKKVMQRNAEKKQGFTGISAVAFNSGINSVADIQTLMPGMAQGVGDNARVGDNIRATSLTIRGFITSNLFFNTNAQCRLGIRMMIVQPKGCANYTSIVANATTWQAGLLKRGGTTVGFTGIVADLMTPINTDLITTYMDKVYYINTPYMQTAVGTAPTINSVKFFTKVFKLKNKLLRYDINENSGLTPTNFYPVLVMGYCHLDGSGPDTVSTQISLTYDSVLNYTDY
mgnify:CR=1 FL=1